MSHFPVLVLLLPLLLNPRTTHSAHHPHGHRGEEFNYNFRDLESGPRVWDGDCRRGLEQSPIDVRYKEQGVQWAYTKFKFNDQYRSNHIGFYATNRGPTMQVQLNANATDPNSPLGFYGGGLHHKYTFAQLHFHWGDRDEVGSEHTLQGQRFPMEIHFVHYKTKYRHLSEALDNFGEDREALVVFAVFCELGKENMALRPIVELAQNLRDPFLRLMHSSRNLNIFKLLPPQLDFVRYLGSLTTPPCTEKVAWTVFTFPIQISYNQLETFRRLHDRRGRQHYNYRPLQKMNGRKLTYFQVPSRTVESTSMLTQTLTTTVEEINFLFDNFVSLINNNQLCEQADRDNNEIPSSYYFQRQKSLNNSRAHTLGPPKTSTYSNYINFI